MFAQYCVKADRLHAKVLPGPVLIDSRLDPLSALKATRPIKVRRDIYKISFEDFPTFRLNQDEITAPGASIRSRTSVSHPAQLGAVNHGQNSKSTFDWTDKSVRGHCPFRTPSKES